MNDLELINRCEKFIGDIGVRVDRFCENAGIGKSTFYRWKNGQIKISDKIKNSINEYLKKFNY